MRGSQMPLDKFGCAPSGSGIHPFLECHRQLEAPVDVSRLGYVEREVFGESLLGRDAFFDHPVEERVAVLRAIRQ